MLCTKRLKISNSGELLSSLLCISQSLNNNKTLIFTVNNIRAKTVVFMFNITKI